LFQNKIEISGENDSFSIEKVIFLFVVVLQSVG
jgi:hypothetical protein